MFYVFYVGLQLPGLSNKRPNEIESVHQ